MSAMILVPSTSAAGRRIVPGAVHIVPPAADRDHVPCMIDALARNDVALNAALVHQTVVCQGIALTHGASRHDRVKSAAIRIGQIIFTVRDQIIVDIQRLLLIRPGTVNAGKDLRRCAAERFYIA